MAPTPVGASFFMHNFRACTEMQSAIMRISFDQHGGMKQFQKQKREEQQPPLPESYLLCRECDGTWVDSRHGACAHCPMHTTSQDFHLCLSCALAERCCQHCGSEIHVHIANC